MCSQAVSRRNPHWTVSEALIPQPHKNILNIKIPRLQSEDNSIAAPQLHVGLVAEASKEEQEQSELLVRASDSLQSTTWGDF